MKSLWDQAREDVQEEEDRFILKEFQRGHDIGPYNSSGEALCKKCNRIITEDGHDECPYSVILEIMDS